MAGWQFTTGPGDGRAGGTRSLAPNGKWGGDVHACATVPWHRRDGMRRVGWKGGRIGLRGSIAFTIGREVAVHVSKQTGGQADGHGGLCGRGVDGARGGRTRAAAVCARA